MRGECSSLKNASLAGLYSFNRVEKRKKGEKDQKSFSLFSALYGFIVEELNRGGVTFSNAEQSLDEVTLEKE